MSDTATNQGAKEGWLGFRLDGDVAEKVRGLADIRDVPYADLLREKAGELADEYDRTIERASNRKSAA